MGVLVVKLILIYLLFSAVFVCCWSSLQSGLGGNATDRLALLAIKAQIKQDLHNYNVMSSWNESTHFCMWHGVTCSRRHRQRVTNLDLQSQNLEVTKFKGVFHQILAKVFLISESSTSAQTNLPGPFLPQYPISQVFGHLKLGQTT
nr:leucine-rich repeat receptor-like serine/threonine-protein kinase BAM2 [Malus domestica]